LWFRGTRDCFQGRIEAGRIMRDFAFVKVDYPDGEKDLAYRSKYRQPRC
jgi:hypothetical protein